MDERVNRMNYRIKQDDKTGQNYVELNFGGKPLLIDPFLNKGLAFTQHEREELGLLGFLPSEIADLKEQCRRAYVAFLSKENNVAKYIYLRSLQDSNETLFYGLLSQRLEEMLPIISKPTVGVACQHFSEIYRYPRGLFLAYPDSNQFDAILANTCFDNVNTIVISDGERILGLGDQGAAGMEISISKLSLYTLCAGIYPPHTLPILLDVGTDNRERLNDPLYLGWRHERIRGQDCEVFLESVVNAIQKRFPHVLLHWEDFAEQNGSAVLERYRERLCMINDDIEGTAAVVLSMILASFYVSKIPLKEQRVVVVGANAIGCKIGQWLIRAMMDEGMSEQEAGSRIFLVDCDRGLLLKEMQGLTPIQQALAQPQAALANWQGNNAGLVSLDSVVLNAQPTQLIGLCGKPGFFTESLVRSMAQHVERPVILPLSTPQSKSEALPQQLLEWTNYRAVIGTGSYFEAIMKKGKIFRIDQANDIYILSGMGLGLTATKTSRATDDLFLVAARALAECSPMKSNADGNLLPSLNQIRSVALKIAIAVANKAIALGLAQPVSEKLEDYIQRNMWVPSYLHYRKVSQYFPSAEEELI